MDEDDLPLDGFDGIVLAGGMSRRMGRNKLLMDAVAARPMIRHVVETVRGVVGHVTVVTGYQHDRIAEALERLTVDYAHTDPTEGQGSAIRAGLALCDPAKDVLVCVGDQPRLTAREIVGLIEAFRGGGRDRILMPERQGVRGYPMVVPASFDCGSLDLAADDLAAAHPDRVAVFVTRNPVYESSVDTPEDYRALFAI